MVNLVLYRKYRPKTFAEIIGQEHIVQTLTNAISSGMISHAYLFSGPRGSGKTSLARLLAKALNCLNRKNFEPCNKCSSCLEINGGISIDLIEIDAASHRGIDEIRELRDGIRFAPTKSKYKVFIVDESHQLTKEAANALLKTLEEPPSHAIFILATTEIHKMIPTILSRCQRFDFRRLTLPEIIKQLEFISKSEKIKIEKPALELLALNSQGALRDAEGLLEQAITFCTGGGDREITAKEIKDLLGIVELSQIINFTDLLLEKRIVEALKFLQEIVNKGLDLQEFTKDFIDYLRKVLIGKISGSAKNENSIIVGLTKEELEKLYQQAAAFDEKNLQNIINLFLEAENRMKYSPIQQLPLELAIMEACGLA